MGHIYAHGETKDAAKLALKQYRKVGDYQVGVVNTDATNALLYTLEGAPGEHRSPLVPNWDAAVAVATGATVLASSCAIVQVTEADAEASHLRHFRLHLQSATAGAPARYTVFGEDDAVSQ